MSILRDFEKRLEGAVEGFFARAFRSGLQPVELAKAIQRYEGNYQQVGVDTVYVPNVYRFTLSPADLERFSGFTRSLQRELADVARRTADEKGWQTQGPIRIEFERSEDIRVGTFELRGKTEDPRSQAARRASGASGAGSNRPAHQVSTATFRPPGAAGGPPPAAAFQPQPSGGPSRPAEARSASPLPASPAPASPAPASPAPASPGASNPPAGTRSPEPALAAAPAAPAPVLRAVQGADAGKIFPLSQPQVVIGRLPDCDITLTGAAVSRRHARVQQEGDRWTITDLGSTNGVRVNAQPVQVAEMRPGDRVEVGDITFTFLLTG